MHEPSALYELYQRAICGWLDRNENPLPLTNLERDGEQFVCGRVLSLALEWAVQIMGPEKVLRDYVDVKVVLVPGGEQCESSGT